MLTVAKVTAGVAAGYANYLEGKSTAQALGDYYLRDGEPVEAPGRFVSGAAAVGCNPGVVSGEVLRELMAVRHPVTGRALRPAGSSGEAVSGLDATFSAPKSVSAVWALADPALRQQVEAAHEHAVDRAMRYAVGEVAMVRRRLDRHTVAHEKAADVVATSWRHTTARSVDGQPPDPQLHSHVLLHAAVRQDESLAAIDSRAWLHHRREIGAAYRTELAHGLAHLGFEIVRGTGRGGRYFEIAGIPQPLLDRWSSRHRQVHEAIQARLDARTTRDGSTGLSAAEERMAALQSREAKQPATTADLDRHWHADGSELGLDHRQVERLRDPARPAPAPVGSDQVVSALTEFDATFTAREARAVALEQSAGLPVERALEPLTQARQQGQVLLLADGRLTTTAHRRLEQSVLATVTRLGEQPVETLDRGAIAHGMKEVDRRLAEQGGELSREQQMAVARSSGAQRVVMIEGQAGTGKSTVLQAVALAHQAQGRQVVITSTAGAAAERLARDLRDVGVSAPAYSTAALGHAVAAGAVTLDATTTIIHDEAALAATREQHQLLQAVEETGARLVIVGDPQQSKPVGAGGLWTRIEHQLDTTGGRVVLSENLRAQDPADRRDQHLFRLGEIEQAVRGYASRNRVHVATTKDTTEEGALQAAHLDRRAGRRTLVIAQTTNDHLDELNAHAQALRLNAGELGTPSLPVPSRPYRLHAGDDVQIRRTVPLPDQPPLRNGTPATILHIDEHQHTADLKLADDTEITLDQESLDGADVRLAYVQHPFPAQGATSDTAHLIVSDHSTREGTYVAITRAREHTHIHASLDTLTDHDDQPPIKRLAHLLSRTEPDLPSIATPLAHEHHLEQRPEADYPAHVDEERPWLNFLGDRPEEPSRQQGWDQAAAAVQDHRDRWNIPSTDPSPLGPEPAPSHFTQRLERRDLAAQLADTLRELGRDLGLAHDGDAQAVERDDPGWEP